MNKGMSIERKSMDIINEYLKDTFFAEIELPIVRRIIHTTGDPEYRHIISIKNNFATVALELFNDSPKIYSDTNMIIAGVNKRTLSKINGTIFTLVDDERVFKKSQETGDTRSEIAIETAIEEGVEIFVIGNAPTALLKLLALTKEGKANPKLIIGVPVGYVGARESKEELRKYDIPQISTVGTKGGSNVAASIVNAILYETTERC